VQALQVQALQVQALQVQALQDQDQILTILGFPRHHSLKEGSLVQAGVIFF